MNYAYLTAHALRFLLDSVSTLYLLYCSRWILKIVLLVYETRLKNVER